MPPRQGHLNRNDTISADPTSLRHDSPALLSDAANGTLIYSEDDEAVGSLVPGIMPRKKSVLRFPFRPSFRKGTEGRIFLAACVAVQ